MATDEIDAHFTRGVELFNCGEFFEAHEEMEEAMNLLDDDTADWDFYLGLLRAALSHEIGSDSQRPFAIVIVGGLLSALTLSIVLLPTFYVWIAREGDELPKAEASLEH